MSQDLYYTDFAILKRLSEAAEDLGGFDLIKADRSVAAMFKERTIADFKILVERYGLIDAAGMASAAIRSSERVEASNNVQVH